MKYQLYVIVAILTFLLLTTRLFAQPDTNQAFIYNKQTGKWETTTAVVKQYAKDMIKLQYQDSIILTQKQSIDTLKRAVDSLLMAARAQDERFEACQENVRLKDKVINDLLKPVQITIKEKKPFMKHIGLVPFLGASYDFSEQKLKEFQFTQLRYYGGIKWIWEILDKVMTDLRIEIPAALKLEVGIKF